MDQKLSTKDSLAYAMMAACLAHKDQEDYHGKSYLQHLLAVAGSLDTEEEMAVALLHDIVEDQPVTIKDLEDAGLPTNIITAVNALTKVDKEDYDSYLKRVISAGTLAIRVKIADISNNLKESRRHTKAESSRERYQKALETLKASLPNV
jgi:(p)ppGpp synthase/HD superfamily hydrolase